MYATFINEIDCAKAIFFVGYSLRDMEIAKRVFHINESIRLKSFIICHEDESEIAKARLAKFGKVYPIGINGFVNLLPDHFKEKTNNLANIDPTYVKKAIKAPASSEVFVDDVDRLILSGEFDSKCYAAQIEAPESAHFYCVERRTKIDELFDAVKNNVNRFIVSSDIGNGKTSFLSQIEARAFENAYEVYHINTNLKETFVELEQLLARKSRQIFLIDDLIRFRTIAKFIGARLSGLSIMVCSSRASLDDNGFSDIVKEFSGPTREIDLNTMSDEELVQWDKLLERYGYWEKRIEWGEDQRFRFLKTDCGAENRSIVVSVFRTSRIAEKINGIVQYFLSRKPQHTRAFVAILINALCQKHVSWGKIVQWINIDEHQLRQDLSKEMIFDFMSSQRNWFQFSSAQLADHILNNFSFGDELVVDVYTTIVRETAFSANDPRSGFDAKENIKELMKYRFLTRLFGASANASASIEAVYDRLSNVQRIRKNDQFWLQYSMSNMEIGKLDTAEKYINTALGIAKKRGQDYSPHQILDQRARLLLIKNTKIPDAPNLQEIETAISDLNKSVNDRGDGVIYPMRAAVYLLDLLDEKIDFLDMPVREKFLNLLMEMEQRLANRNLERSRKGEIAQLSKAVKKSILVLKNA